MSHASATLAVAEAHRIKGDFDGAARVLDAHLLSLPERDEEGLMDVLLERARIALASGAIQEARLRLRELTEREGGTPGRWCSLAGVLAALVGDHESARPLIWRAVAVSRVTGNPQLEARAWSTLAMVYVDTQQLIEAAGAIAYAFAVGPDSEQLPSSLAVRAELAYLKGDLEDADVLFTQSIGAAEDVGAPWAAGAAHATRAAVRAQQGHCDESALDLSVARQLLSRVPNRWTRATVELWAGFLDLARGEPERARARLAVARSPVAEGLALLDADLGGRAAARQLSAALGDTLAPGRAVGRPCLRVARDGASLALGEAKPHPIRSTAARRILLSLASAAVHSPGQPVPASALVEAGWPGESILREAALNRLYVTLHQLRRAGLAPVLVTRRDGYMLDAEHVEIAGRSALPAPQAR